MEDRQMAWKWACLDDYWMMTTTDNKGNEALRGGMMKRQMPQQQGITTYFDVKSVQEYSSKVEQLGGKVIFPKRPVSGMGYFAVCLDTENNSFAIWETDSKAKWIVMQMHTSISCANLQAVNAYTRYGY